MTEAEWLVSNHPLPMVTHVLDNVSHKKLARLVVALHRINGKVNECNEVESLIDTSTQKSLLWGDCRSLAVGCAWACTDGRDNGKAGADAIRDIIGNPFRKVTIPNDPRCRTCGGVGRFTVGSGEDAEPMQCPCCPWLTPTVLSLAHAAYNIRCRGCNQCYDGWLPGECIRLCPNVTDGTLDPARLAVLADALEEAGCDNSGGVCPECNGSGELGTLGGKIGCYVCASDYKTRGTGRSNRRLLRCQCGGNYGIVKKDLFPAPLSSCQKCWADGPSWADVIRGEVLPHPILAHLRSPGPHWRGCWAIDLILRKE